MENKNTTIRVGRYCFANEEVFDGWIDTAFEMCRVRNKEFCENILSERDFVNYTGNRIRLRELRDFALVVASDFKS